MLSRYNIINRIFRPNHIPKQTMNVQKNIYTHKRAHQTQKGKYDARCTYTYTHTPTHTYDRKQMSTSHAHITQITGQIDVQSSKNFYKIKKKTFQRIEKGKKKEHYRSMWIRHDKNDELYRRAFKGNTERNLTCLYVFTCM